MRRWREESLGRIGWGAIAVALVLALVLAGCVPATTMTPPPAATSQAGSPTPP